MAGKLRLTWFDSTRQHELCTWFLSAGGGSALRPTTTTGSNAAGRAAAVTAANAAAAAKVSYPGLLCQAVRLCPFPV